VTDHASVATPVPGEETWATYLGLPDSIINLLAEIVNLCADQPTENPTTVKARADRIEKELKEWHPISLPSTSDIDSTALVSKTIAGQLWRLCAVVLLYQVRSSLINPATIVMLTAVCSSSRWTASNVTPCPKRDPKPPRRGGSSTKRRSMGFHRPSILPRGWFITFRYGQKEVDEAHDSPRPREGMAR
jgi:hypothetical protein